MTGETVRALVVEDSITVRASLVALLRADPGIDVVGEASNGREAIEMVTRLRPSIVLMDIEMPVMDGFESAKRIMVEDPTPIIIVTSAHNPRDVEVSLRALRVGALTVLPKPAGPGSPGFAREAAWLVQVVKALAEVKVVRRRWLPDVGTPAPRFEPLTRPRLRTGRAIAVAASTGGPAALYRLLELLPADIDVPVLLVQHIAAGFVEGLASWLGSGTALPVKVAQSAVRLEPGTVYVGPDDRHFEIDRDETIRLSESPSVGGFRPSANNLFSSVAAVYGRAAVGVVLTGMGADGLQGARDLRAAGGMVFAQDEATSVVFGMPRAVIDAGVVDVVGSIDQLVSSLLQFVPLRRR